MVVGISMLCGSPSDNGAGDVNSCCCRPFALICIACFLRQVCERQASDKKGGHLARRKKDGRLM